MTRSHIRNKYCPHCKHLLEQEEVKSHRSHSSVVVAIAVAVTALNLYYLYIGAIAPSAKQPQAPKPENTSVITPEVLGFISQTPLASCGQCAADAHKAIADGKAMAQRNLTDNMVLIKAGVYQMGSTSDIIGKQDERPRHDVELDAYYMDKTEVTYGEYMEFAKTFPDDDHYPIWLQKNSRFYIDGGYDQLYKAQGVMVLTLSSSPVVGVNWKEASEYCAWRHKRLPTEAEWEIAARGGTKSLYSFGSDPTAGDKYMWTNANAGKGMHPVATKLPNQYGIYDMHGNVWEWVQDYYDIRYYKDPPRFNPRGPAEGTYRVIRGGSWAFEPLAAASATRGRLVPSSYGDDLGFRCALSASEVQ